MRKFWIATLAAALLSGSQASAITTRPAWNGFQTVGSFGCPESSTFGQTITIPKFKHTLGKVTFTMHSDSGAGSLIMRGEVYQWDGQKAIGSAVYETGPMTIKFKLATDRLVSFSPNVSVTPGGKYVVFLTVDKDYGQCTNEYFTLWGAVNDSVYSKGSFVYLNAGGDSSLWTETAWGNNQGVDAVFNISFPN